MADPNQIDERFRKAARELQGPPVRWHRVAVRVQRRSLLGLAALILVGIALTVLLATGVIAGKSALDSSFDPPILSQARTSIEFDEPPLGRGLTQLEDFLRENGQRVAPLPVHTRLARGYVLEAGVRVVGHEGEGLEPRWRIARVVGSDKALPLAIYRNTSAYIPESDDETRKFRAWVMAPKNSDRYVVEFWLSSSEHQVVARASSEAFSVFAEDFFAPYRTDSYVAKLPKGWQLASDYVNMSGQRYVSRALGSAIEVLIDTTLDTRGDPAESARTLEESLTDREEYRRLVFRRVKLGENLVFEWSYRLGDQTYTDILFYRGEDGFGVLGKGPVDRFKETRTITREIARSVTTETP